MLSFHFHEDPPSDWLTRLIAQTDRPCVWSGTFLRGTAPHASYIVAFSVEHNGALAALAVGTLTRRLLRSHLILPTYPRLLTPEPDVLQTFWEGIKRYCRDQRVETLRVNSFEALTLQTPSLDNLVFRRERSEFYIDLNTECDVLFKNFSTNHRRNINKALKERVTFKIGGEEDFERHLAAFTHTQRRRELRNESRPHVNEQLCRQLLSAGDGHLMQLYSDDELLSSFLILSTPKRAFYFSGTTSKRGMEMGASHYLMWLTIQEIRARGARMLSLGGVAAGVPEGLARYKRGFGTQETPLVYYEFFTGRPLVRKLTHLGRLMRDTLVIGR